MPDTPNMTPDDKYVAALEDAIEKIWDIARRLGLDPFPVNFELVPASIMYEFGSYGLPGRFSHWTRGKSYYRMKTEYDYGLSKIYELVVNTNPSYAFLMEQNSLLQNKLVIAHVLGHTDFFKNNVYFKHTPPNMIDKVSVNADRIRKYEFDHGRLEVERFLDAVLAIEEHIDPNFHVKRETYAEQAARLQAQRDHPPQSAYEDLWRLEAREAEDEEPEPSPTPRQFPPQPEKDVLLFLAEHAPNLEDWQRDILLIVREEMQYFIPQMQTKTMNEGWACLVGSSLVLTEHGLMRYDALHRQLAHDAAISVGSGSGRLDRITDRHVRPNAPTIRLRTRRGLVIEGAEEHRLSIGPDRWLALKDVSVGQRIPLCVGDNLWAQRLVRISTPPRVRVPSVEDVAVAAGVGVHTVYRSLSGKTTYAMDRIALAIERTGYQLGQAGKPQYRNRLPLVAPTHLTEAFAEFLGYLIGDGNIHPSKHTIGYTTGDRALADRYAALMTALFAITPSVFWDARTRNNTGGRWRVVFYSANVLELLASLGIDLQAKARQKRIPDGVLRSPKSVVSAFLRAYFDCDGCASAKQGVILSTFSDAIAQTLQILLLNYGILSRRRGPNIWITGKSAQLFAHEIGFGLARKQEHLRAYLASHRWFWAEDPSDEVVSVEHGRADVYDITVDASHRYVANGMLHHNSFWHSRILRELDLSDSEYTEFAQLHSSVLSPQRMRLNPYHLGYKMLEDIERRWDHPSEEDQAQRAMKPGQGRAKIFEVREEENDVSFLRNYLTKELVEDLDLFIYKKVGDEWVIVEKDWEKVRDIIVANMTNFGYPYLTITDGDFNHNSELLIRHHFEGQEMDLEYADKTLEYVHLIWQRPVHLETIFDGKRVRLSYNGDKHDRKVLDQKGDRGERSGRG
jgi:stage V sporulation protein R